MSTLAERVLVARRRIAASPERLFDAWTRPEALVAWWGPRGVRCVGAQWELRVGGRYRLDNAMPDGRIVVISGEMLSIDRPYGLSYTWSVDGAPQIERVNVRFEAQGEHTEVIVTHERIPDEPTLRAHELGWEGCFDGLQAFV